MIQATITEAGVSWDVQRTEAGVSFAEITEPATVASNPTEVRRAVTMRQLSAADADARYMRARRQDAARNGYRGPLTRDELAKLASR